MSTHRCEVCHQSDDDVRIIAVGGVMPSNIPLHAHTLHADCASLYERGQCESCCSVIAEVGTLKARLAEVEKELSHERELTDARKIVRRAERKIVRDEHLTELQRESARVNEMSGVIAHLVGVLAEVHRATSIDNAKTFAEIALANIEAWHADAWKPGPSDDAADWKPEHWKEQA